MLNQVQRRKFFPYSKPFAVKKIYTYSKEAITKVAKQCYLLFSSLVKPHVPITNHGIETKTVIHGWVKYAKTKKGVSNVDVYVYSGGKEIAKTKNFMNGSYFIVLAAYKIVDFKINMVFATVTQQKWVFGLHVNKQRIKHDVELQ